MSRVASGTPPPAWVAQSTVHRLGARLREALARARSTGAPVLASVSAPALEPVDSFATAACSRRPGEPWFVIEQPDRDGAAVAGIGAVEQLLARGEGRFGELDRAWRELAAQALADPPAGPPGSGLAVMGGFAFAPDGGDSPRWSAFAPASMVVPEVSFAARGGETWITLNARVCPDDAIEDLDARAATRLAELRAGPLPLLDPAPAGRFAVRSPMPPSHYEDAVARAVQRIRAGELEKVVLAREVEVDAPADHDPAAVAGVLREGFPACFTYAVGYGGTTFLGASPELLVRREGQRASTVALAGSIRRSADPSVDDHLGEQLLHS
ncbi:MAG TPA: chorismate-binding protein, partial [Solirubrobacteraceae bacterium]|nr:chorismate-binding protein [Solirubrobacteraceae bacterium]